MFRNYLKTAFRNLQRNRLYSFINITGLSIGIACCMLIFLYIQYGLSYVKYNTNADRIYRLTEVLHVPKAFIVNETAVKNFSWGTAEQAIGKQIDWSLGKKGKIKPLILTILPDFSEFVAVSIESIKAALANPVKGLRTE